MERDRGTAEAVGTGAGGDSVPTGNQWRAGRRAKGTDGDWRPVASGGFEHCLKSIGPDDDPHYEYIIEEWGTEGFPPHWKKKS